MKQIIEKIANDYKLKRGNHKYVGPCPDCGGSSTSDKFQIRDDGGYKCYGCDLKGDLITWLRTREGMSCPEAHQAIDKICTNTACPVRGKCRMGDGNGTGGYRPQSVSPANIKQNHAALPVVDKKNPEQRWLDWATALVAAGKQNISKRKKELSWLADRGIDQAAVSRFDLGWMSRNSKIDRESIGLEPKEDGKKHLWIPAGLVIPVYDDFGNLHRIRIRRTADDRKKFLPNLKYVWIEGSGTAPMVIAPGGTKARGAVIVEAELDGFACASAHERIMAIALGTVRGGLSADLQAELADLPIILVALDADSNGSAAGQKAIGAWTSTYRRARYWPVPDGKDPGEYAELGGSLHDWIYAGLPPEVVSSPASTHDNISIPARVQPGGAGPDNNSQEKAGNGPELAEITLTDGTVLLITDNRKIWLKMAEMGKVVFSNRELLRLQQACSELEPDEAELMKQRVIEAKQVFGPAYVYRGGCPGAAAA